MIKKRTTQSSIILFAYLWLSLPVAMVADNSTIPDEYESLYHHLLEQKQRYLDDRADSIRNLAKSESWISQADKTMKSSSVLIRQKLISSRAYLESLRDQYRKDLDFEEEQLQNIEKDLTWLEAEMKHLACMK